MSASRDTLRAVRPTLKSGLLAVWRDRDTVQIGIDPRRAVALTGMGRAAVVIGLLDGSRDRAQVIAAARDQGIPAPITDRILMLLAGAGALDDQPAAMLGSLPQPMRRRLTAELATASLAHRDGDGGARTLARRRAARVLVSGGGRIGTSIAEVLSAAGVTALDIVPAGAQAGHGRPSSAAARALSPGQLPLPDLAILVGRQAPELTDWLMRARVAHLAASAGEAIGVVGPLVRPGQTACLRCLDFIRSERDPAWPLILAQLAIRQADPPACDAALAAAVAAQAAAQAVAFVDRAPLAAAAENGTLELVLPGWQWRRRSWPAHRAGSCGGARSAGP